MEKLNHKILYISLHNFLRKKAGISGMMSRKDFNCDLGRHFLIPKQMRPIVMKELENMNIIEMVDRNTIKVLECEFDLEDDPTEFYVWAGIF